MKFAIKIKSDLFSILAEAKYLVFLSRHPENTIFYEKAACANQDDDYCAVGALLQAEYGTAEDLNRLNDIRIKDAVQLLFFAIPVEIRDRVVRKTYDVNSPFYIYPGERENVNKRRLRAVYVYNDQSTRMQILQWIQRAQIAACA